MTDDTIAKYITIDTSNWSMKSADSDPVRDEYKGIIGNFAKVSRGEKGIGTVIKPNKVKTVYAGLEC